MAIQRNQPTGQIGLLNTIKSLLNTLIQGQNRNEELITSSDDTLNSINNSTVVNKLGFSTSDLLANGATYDSTVLNIATYTQVQTSILSDVNGTIVINFLRDSDGTDVLRTLTIPYIGGSGFQMFSAPAFTPYVRYQFTADEAGQTDFYFDTKFLRTALSAQVLGADAFISPAMTSSLTRSVGVGKDPQGNYTNTKSDGLGFQTSDLLANGATYDSTVLDLQYYTQVQTNILSDIDGTIVVDFIRDEAGTDILRTLTIPYTGGSGYQTFSAPAFTPYVRYRFTANEAGQSDFYFDTKFLTKPLSGQLLGVDAFISPLMVANLGRNVLVGKTSGGAYNNVAIEPVTNALDVSLPRSAFGEIETVEPTPVVQADFIYNINADMINSTVTGSGTVTQADSMAVLQTTAATSSSAKIETRRFLKYRPGQGCHIRGTALFTTGVANSEQLFGCGDVEDGLFFGFNGTSFGIMTRNNSVDTWVAQADWNGDKMDGTGGSSNPTGQNLDPTKGNVYQINFQWLGFGLIEFAIEDSATGRFVPVHSIAYANANTVPSLTNPSFPILWSVENTTNTTNITLKGASCVGEIEGKIEYLGPTNAIGNSKINVGTGFTNILTIQNKSTYQTLTNRTPINILKYSVSVDGTKPAEFQILKNTTLGGTPAYTDISTNTSVIEYDTAGTTVTGGQTIDFGTLGSTGTISEGGQVTTDIIILPGETLTIAVRATQSTTDVTVAIRWVEDF